MNCADVVRSELNKPLGSTAPIYHQPRYGVDWDDQNSGSKSARRPKLIDYWGEREQFGYKPSFTPGATAGSKQQAANPRCRDLLILK